MTVEEMARPFEKIKKLRSLDEALTRGGQAFNAYREQRRGGTEVPTDIEFFRFVDRAHFGTTPILAETLWQRFYSNSADFFFPVFRDPSAGAVAFHNTFGDAGAARILDSADRIVSGRIDLLGLRGLYVGDDVDWHREPLTLKRSPLKHWKLFDDLDSTETGNKKVLWELNRHQYFFTLGVAYWLTGDEKYGQKFSEHLTSWMNSNPPGVGINWSSSLEVAFRCMSWLWALNFFKDSEYLTPSLFKDALKYLYLQGRHIESYLSKYFSPNTHLTGEALGLYYLGTQLPFFERASSWRKLAEDILYAEATKQIYEDGVYFEQSTWYQRYTVDIFSHFVFLRSLRDEPYLNAEATSLENRLENAFDHLLSVTMPNGKTPLIGDDDGGRMLPLTSSEPDDFRGSLSVASYLFDRGDLKFVSDGPREELFWLAGIDGIESFKAIKEHEPSKISADFKDGGYFIMRDGWEDSDNYMLIDCGEVGSLKGGHGHADSLAIVAAIKGQPLLVDSGTYTYHESRELRDHFRSSAAHNTVTIDGVSSSEPGATFNWKSRAQCTVQNRIIDERFDLFEGSHDGFERLDDPATHSRSVFFVKGDYWIIRDFIKAEGSHRYELNFHYHPLTQPTVFDPRKTVGDRGHRLITFGDGGGWEQKESWFSAEHGNRCNAPLLRYVANGIGPQEFFSFLIPAEPGLPVPDVNEVESPQGRAFTVNYRGYTDVFVFDDDDSNAIDNGIFISNFRYSWARIRPGEPLPDEMILVCGDHLSVKGQSVLTQDDPQFACVRRFGSQLCLRTANGRSSVSIGV